MESQYRLSWSINIITVVYLLYSSGKKIKKINHDVAEKVTIVFGFLFECFSPMLS